MKIYLSEQDKIPVQSGGVGLFFEDLNYALDGGLYAEMLENRNFEAKDVSGKKDEYTIRPDGGYAWEPFPLGAEVTRKIKTDRPLFAENPHYMMLRVPQGGWGVRNKAYDGVYVKKGMGYKISFYARSYDYKGKAAVGVYAGGNPVFEKKVRLRPDGKWHSYSVHVKCRCDADAADFAFTLLKAGAVHIDCFSMMPDDAIYGIFRRDLAELIKAIKPGFLRFPGGCVIEGNTLENRYQWKNSIGQKERRRHNWNRWATFGGDEDNGYHTKYSHYGQTLGVGYYEYFRLCEYLGAKPVPVVNVGLACQYESRQSVPLDSPEFEQYIQDALDIVEFANGGEDTIWGKVRAEMGHPQPFGLEFLAIGNEQWQTEESRFFERYERFEARIHEKYPEIKLIGTAGPTVGTSTYDSAWEWARRRAQENEAFVYAMDEHFYMPVEWMYGNTDMYDHYPRGTKVYAGEYAGHIPGLSCTMNTPQANAWASALAEAAFMTGMERNPDVVVMGSYAPLFARLGYTQWSPDMIWFDGKGAYVTANYYVQQLYSLYTGDYSLKVRLEGAEGLPVYASATQRGKYVCVKIVNAGEEEETLEADGDFDFGSLMRIVCMSGKLNDYNTMEEPDKIAPREIAPSAPRTLTLPPHSFCTIAFRKDD